MARASSIAAAGHGHDRPVIDTVILNFAQRSAQKIAVTGVKGGSIEIDLHRPVRLRTDDLLVLDDDTLVEVVAAPEPVIEARAADVAVLARLAWHLGDRHIAAQVLPNRIRVQRDPAIEALLLSLGAKITVIDVPFEPEGGAYGAAAATTGHGHAHAHAHAHAHGHGQEHVHGTQTHVHGPDCGHDHDHGHHGHDHDH